MFVRTSQKRSIIRTKHLIILMICFFILTNCGQTGTQQGQTSTQQGQTPQSFSYQIRVQDKETGLGIERARVTISVKGQAPIDELTDSNGLARVLINSAHANQPGQLRVEADNFRSYVQNIDIEVGTLPDNVQLVPVVPPSAPTATAIPAATAIPPTAIPTDWKQLVRVEQIGGLCPEPHIVPSYIDFSQDPNELIKQLMNADTNGEVKRWPLAARMPFDTDEHFIFEFDLTSLVENGNEQVNIELPIKVSVITQQDIAQQVNVVAPGQCGAFGVIRVLSPLKLQQGLQVQLLTSEEAPFFFLKPKEAERFRLVLSCHSPGIYSLKIDIPYKYMGNRGSIALEDFPIFACPKEVRYLRLGWLYSTGSKDLPPIYDFNTYIFNDAKYAVLP